MIYKVISGSFADLDMCGYEHLKFSHVITLIFIYNVMRHAEMVLVLAVNKLI